jgi:hypothetical protein
MISNGAPIASVHAISALPLSVRRIGVGYIVGADREVIARRARRLESGALVGVPAGAVPSCGGLVHHRFVAAPFSGSIVDAGGSVMRCCPFSALAAD